MSIRKINLLDAFTLDLVVLSDHPMIAAGCQSLLSAYPDIRISGVVDSIQALLDHLRQHDCHVLLTEYYLPKEAIDGSALIRYLHCHHPDLAIVVYTAGKAQDIAHFCRQAGANGFLEKDAPVALIHQTMHQCIHHPGAFFMRKGNAIQPTEPAGPSSLLTFAEQEVLRLIAYGMSISQIAERVHRSRKTISSHKRRAMKKLRVNDDLGLALLLKDRLPELMH